MELPSLGLTSTSLEVYQQLVAADSMTVDRLAHVLSTDRGRILHDLGELEARGLVSRRVNDSDDYIAARPSVALGASVAEAHDQLKRMELLMGELEHAYATARHGRSAADVVDIVLGSSAVRARLHQLQVAAKREVLSLVKAPVAVLSSQENEAEDTAVARGVRYRVVLERAMLEEEPRLYQEMVRVRTLGEEFRLADSVPIKLFVVDREVAIVPLGPTADGAIIVRRSGLLDALVALFDSVWRTGVDPLPDPVEPAGPPEDEPIDEFDRHVLSLLLTGLTDQAVAGALGTSARTVQRRVRVMMDLAGVSTRIQLGASSVDQQWLRRR